MKKTNYSLVYSPKKKKSSAPKLAPAEGSDVTKSLRKKTAGKKTSSSKQSSKRGVKSTVKVLARPDVELTSKKRATTQKIGIWDIGANVPFVSNMVEELNSCQKFLKFFQIHAPVPAGVVSTPERVVRWANEQTDFSFDTKSDMAENLIAPLFYPFANKIRLSVGVDVIVGLTASRVMDVEDEFLLGNLFYSFDENMVVVSTCDLDKISKKAGRPYEVSVMFLIITALLAERHYPKLKVHNDRGCIFDWNGDRISLYKCIRKPIIDKECLSKLESRYRATAEAIFRKLVSYESPK